MRGGGGVGWGGGYGVEGRVHWWDRKRKREGEEGRKARMEGERGIIRKGGTSGRRLKKLQK